MKLHAPTNYVLVVRITAANQHQLADVFGCIIDNRVAKVFKDSRVEWAFPLHR